MEEKLLIIGSVYIIAIVCVFEMKKLEPDSTWYWKYVLVVLAFWTIIWVLMLGSGL